MRQVNIAIAGFGGVGRSVGGLLLARRERYRSVYGVDVRLVAVCGSRSGIADAEGLEIEHFDNLADGRSGVDFILGQKPDILIEAGPSDFRTGAPGHGYIGATLDAGIHAVVISKGALVFDGQGLRKRARQAGVLLKVSGATGAALPTIDLLEYSLKGCEVLRVEGILNATTNFLLSAMTEGSLSFSDALKQAQEKGFAESDPRNDTEGWDTACKLLILANFGMDAGLVMRDITVEGIQNITHSQMTAWKDRGLAPKLVGAITREKDVLTASVGVKAFPTSNVFSSVSGKTKAIRVVTDTMGETVAIGGGDEPLATAAAALKDLEHIIFASYYRNFIHSSHQ